MAGKVSFDDIYDQPDPRAFFRTLEPLDYQIPEHARGPFRFLAGRLRQDAAGEEWCVLDLCCSYGINAMLLNHDVDLTDLYARYGAADARARTPAELIASDRSWFARHRREPVPIVGLDAAGNAVDYAVRAGLLHAGHSEDLEVHDPSDALQRHLADVRLVTVTGGIGYITETTFDRLLHATATDRMPWIAAFSLRWIDLAPIGAVLADHGYVLETAARTFHQRRFATTDERDHAFARLRELGLDPDGIETDGYHHATFHLARPRTAADRIPPLEQVLAAGA